MPTCNLVDSSRSLGLLNKTVESRSGVIGFRGTRMPLVFNYGIAPTPLSKIQPQNSGEYISSVPKPAIDL